MPHSKPTGRGPQVRPTQRRRIELYRQLDELARKGDANAVGWLLLLSDEPPRAAAN